MFPMHDTEMRIAMMQAADEARTHGHGPVGADHLLLGLLANLRGSTQHLLAEHGVSYADASQRVLASRGTGDEQPPAPTVEDDRDALGAIGIDLDRVRESVLDNFGEDITEDWGGRGPRARRGGGRGHRGPDPRTSRDGGGRGRGRGRRGPGSGRFGPHVDDDLREVLQGLGESMRPSWSGLDERPSREEVRRLRASLSKGMADRVLLSMLRSDDPKVATALGDADRDAIIRDLEARLDTAAPATAR